MGIALFPGAFKPPTKGHFLAVKELATNTFRAAKWDEDERGRITPGTLKSGKADERVDKVIVIISNKARNGITAKDSVKVWDIYKKYLPNNVAVSYTHLTLPTNREV